MVTRALGGSLPLLVKPRPTGPASGDLALALKAGEPRWKFQSGVQLGRGVQLYQSGVQFGRDGGQHQSGVLLGRNRKQPCERGASSLTMPAPET